MSAFVPPPSRFVAPHRARTRRLALAVAIAWIALLASGAAHANMAQTSFEGDRTGLLAPEASPLRVVREDLELAIDPSYERARIVARYQLANPTDAAVHATMAFAFQRGETARDAGLAASVAIDGAATPFTEVLAGDGGDGDPIVRAWTQGYTRGPIGWLAFDLDVPARAERRVEVGYEHVASLDDSFERVDPTYGFDYLLSPAKRFASFGALAITVKLPADADFASPLPFTRKDARTYALEREGLPDGELHVDVIPRDGRWLGMNDASSYWVIFLALLGLVNVPLSVRLGRRWARSARTFWGRLARAVFLSGSASLAASTITLALFSAIAPKHALGSPYTIIFLGPVLFLAIAFVAAIVGMRATAKRTLELEERS